MLGNLHLGVFLPMTPFLINRIPGLWTDRKVVSSESTTRVLIVDDNCVAAEALATYLSLEGFDCHAVFDGLQAVEMGTVWVPDVVLMDISMPECNGFEAAMRLRQFNATANVAIIAFTAFDEGEVRTRATQHTQHQFDGYCQKGQPLHHLLDLVYALTTWDPRTC